MKFDELDKRLRIYETSHDFCVPPGIYMIARIDGRSFTKLTKERHRFKKPFDETFRDYMVETVKHLMNCGFNITYGYTGSDEISLLFDLKEEAFSRKTRKYNSVLAGEASAKFSLLLGDMGVFDCRISQLPSKKEVTNYFSWRNEDTHRNALNSHCYSLLRKLGKSATEATREIKGQSNAYKNELLFTNGSNFNNLPNWQKRGVGLYWIKYEKKGWNPVNQKEASAIRREIKVDMHIPIGDKYNDFIMNLLDKI